MPGWNSRRRSSKFPIMSEETDASATPTAPVEPVAKPTLRKTYAWIFDGTGVARRGWLQVLEGDGDARPADKGWRTMAALPGPPGSLVHVFIWADDVDKYIARLDVGSDRRWIIMEGLPAFLETTSSLSDLVQLGAFGAPPG